MSTGTRATAISHVGIVVNDAEMAAREWCERYGLEVVARLEADVESIRSVFVSPGYGRDEGICIELMEPYDKTDMDSAVARRLAEKGEGVYHIAMRVEDGTTAAADLTAAGVTAIGLPSAEPNEGPRTIVHPKAANGVLLELY